MRIYRERPKLTQGSSDLPGDAGRLRIAKKGLFPLARCFARMAHATRVPAALDPYFLPALVAIMEKFLPGLPMSLPSRKAPTLGYNFGPR
jgi:hypothetical protein